VLSTSLSHFAIDGDRSSAGIARRLEAMCEYELETRSAQNIIEQLRTNEPGTHGVREGAIQMAHNSKVLMRLGKTKPALVLCRSARRRLSGRADTHYVTAAMLEAELLSTRGYLTQAIRLASEAHSFCRSHRYRPGVARTLMELSKLYRRTGQNDRALECVRGARVLFELLGDLGNLGTAHMTEGNIHLERGQLEDAMASYKRSLSNGGRSRRPHDVAVASSNIAILWRNRGAWTRAMRLFKAALEVNKTIPSPEGMARDSENIAIIYLLKKEFRAANRWFARALSLYTSIGKREGIAINLNNRALSLRLEGDCAAARVLVKDALALNRRLRRPIGIAAALQNRAEIEFATGQWRRALRSVECAYQIACRFSYTEALVDCLDLKARIYCDGLGEPRQAVKLLDIAMIHARRMKAERRMKSLTALLQRVSSDGRITRE
jgi:tetratricopeptide (TPR) repeat protein